MATELQTQTAEFYDLNDILAVFEEHETLQGFTDDFYENYLNNEVSFGDAELTLVRGGLINYLLNECWDDGDYATEALKQYIWERLPELEGALVALIG